MVTSCFVFLAKLPPNRVVITRPTHLADAQTRSAIRVIAVCVCICVCVQEAVSVLWVCCELGQQSLCCCTRICFFEALDNVFD